MRAMLEGIARIFVENNRLISLFRVELDRMITINSAFMKAGPECIRQRSVTRKIKPALLEVTGSRPGKLVDLDSQSAWSWGRTLYSMEV